MAQVIDDDLANLEVHFLHSDDPRDGFCVMSTNPSIYYEFRTPIGFRSTHTIVRARLPPFLPLGVWLTPGYKCNNPQVTDASGATLVTLNWFGPSALGTIMWPGPPMREVHMGDLVHPTSSMPE
jgi:hypothetical protein